MAGCRIQGGPRASAGSLVAGVRVLKTLGLCQLMAEVSAGLLAGKASSCSVASGPRDPRTYFRVLVGGHLFLTQLDSRSGVQDILKVLLAC